MRFLPRLLIALLAAWLILDAAMPFMPGAFQFDPDDCVEVVSAPDQSMVVAPDRRVTTPLETVSVSVRADVPAGVRSYVPHRPRVVRRDGPRRHDLDRGSSVRSSDPA